jgi:hypothetical protein
LSPYEKKPASKLINEAEMIGAPTLTHFNKHYTPIEAS